MNSINHKEISKLAELNRQLAGDSDLYYDKKSCRWFRDSKAYEDYYNDKPNEMHSEDFSEEDKERMIEYMRKNNIWW